MHRLQMMVQHHNGIINNSLFLFTIMISSLVSEKVVFFYQCRALLSCKQQYKNNCQVYDILLVLLVMTYEICQPLA